MAVTMKSLGIDQLSVADRRFDRGSGRGSLLLSGMGHLLISRRARTAPE